MEHRIETKEEAIQTLKSNLCGICPYSCSDMDSCDMRYCDNKDAIEFLEKETQPCEDTISRKHLISGIDELMQSPWFNNGKDFYDGTMKHYGYVERKEAVEVVRDLCVKAEPAVILKQKWIPLTWDESKCESSFPDDMDGCWAIFTNGKNISIERGKKDAFDHFFPSGRWFEMSDAIAWMPLPKYKEGEKDG